MKLLSSLVLLCAAPLLFVLWCLLSPPLLSYHPFHPNHSHLPSSYASSDHWLSRLSPSLWLSSAIVPSSFIEGWYVKLRTASGRHFALIFMYFVSARPDQSTAAVTLLDAQTERSHLFRYPIEQFRSSPLPGLGSSVQFLLPSFGHSASHSPYHDFELRVGNNTLSPYAVTASLRSDGQSEAWVSAEVDLTLRRTEPAATRLAEQHSAYPWSAVFSPASHTVGLFAFLPLACYQQVIELQLAVTGHITLDGQRIDFDAGTAYFEKTRGSTFPDDYLWIHASHFTDSADDTVTADVHGANSSTGASSLSSFFFSLASVPIVPTSVRLPGFVCSFVLDGRTSHYATQLGSVLTSLRIDERTVEFVLYDQHFTTRVAVTVTRHAAPIDEHSWLWAARNGHLQRVIPQRIGRDKVHVTVQHVDVRADQAARHDGSDVTAERSSVARTGAELDEQSFTSRGHSLSRVLSASSASAGLEVFVHESELQRQVAAMYADVRPWLSERYLALDTPLVSFSISDTFVRSLLPHTLTGLAARVSVRHCIFAACVSSAAVVALVLALLLPRLVCPADRKLKLE